MRVLYAGSNPSFIQSLKLFLSQHEHDLQVVNNGIGCMFTLKNHAINLLIVEQNLLWGGADGVLSLMCDDPGLTGYYCRRIDNPKRQQPYSLGFQIKNQI